MHRICIIRRGCTLPLQSVPRIINTKEEIIQKKEALLEGCGWGRFKGDAQQGPRRLLVKLQLLWEGAAALLEGAKVLILQLQGCQAQSLLPQAGDLLLIPPYPGLHGSRNRFITTDEIVNCPTISQAWLLPWPMCFLSADRHERRNLGN